MIENRAGGGWHIAAEAVARAARTDTPCLWLRPANASTASVYKLPYDVVSDFAPVTLVAVAPSVLVVHPSLPVRSVKELVAYAKAHPNELLFASSGNGRPAYMRLEMVKLMTGNKIVHGNSPG